MSENTTPFPATQTVETTTTTTAPAQPPADIATARDWLLKANPNVVPELVTGSTLAELEASLPKAQAAHAAIADKLRQETHFDPAEVPPPVVPAGAAVNIVDVDSMSAEEKVRYGLQQRQNRRRP